MTIDGIDGLMEGVDDRTFLREFPPTELCDTPFLNSWVAGGSNLKILFLSRKVPKDFLKSESSKPFQKCILIVPDESFLPLSAASPFEAVYLLAHAGFLSLGDSQSDPMASAILNTFKRIFLFDYWDEMEACDFLPPDLSADDPKVFGLFKEFLLGTLEPHLNFYRFLKPRPISQNGGRALIISTDRDPLMECLEKIFPNSTPISTESGFIHGKGFDPSHPRKPSMGPHEFRELLEKQKIDFVVTRNLNEISPFEGTPSKAWVLDRLKIPVVAVQVDSFLDGLNPFYLHLLPKNVSVVTLHTPETFEACNPYFERRRLYKSSQAIPFRSSENTVGSLQNPDKIVVASICRHFLFKAYPKLSLLLLPLAKKIATKELPIYLTYLLFLEAVPEIERTLKSDFRFLAYRDLSFASVMLRTLIRYWIIDKAEAEAEKKGIEFQIFGDADWQKIFPDSFQNKFLNAKELEGLYPSSVILDPTPSIGFASQHPMTAGRMFKGARVLAPSPVWINSDPEEFRRFYFKRMTDLPRHLEESLRSRDLLSHERKLLSDRFGIEGLKLKIESIVNRLPPENSSLIPTFSELRNFLTEQEKQELHECSFYFLGVYAAQMQGLSNRQNLEILRGNVSDDLLMDLENLLHDEKTYLNRLTEEFRFLSFAQKLL